MIEELLSKGSVDNLSDNEYHALGTDFYSSSHLKYLTRTSPFHFNKKFMYGDGKVMAPTSSMKIGSVAHSLLFGGSDIEKDFVITEKIDGRTNAGKIERARLDKLALTKTVMTEDEYALGMDIATAVNNNKFAKHLLDLPGKSEQSLFWTCPFSGLNFRARPDKYTDDYLIEFKTSMVINKELFAKQSVNLNYHLSLYHYLEGLRVVLGPRERKCIFIVCENIAPFAVSVFEVSTGVLDLGHSSWLEAVTALEVGIKQDVWPVNGETLLELGEFEELEYPRWAFRGHE